MRVLREVLLWACLFITFVSAHNVTRRETKGGGSKRVVCYYTNWSVYRPGTAKFNPQNINPYLCTHLIYAFGGLTRENGLRPYDKYQDIEQGGYAKFTGLKTYNKQLKTMLAIGGWNEGSTRFSPLVASEDRRMEFVKNVVRFLRQNHFDGLDLDWEYPAFRDGGKPRDRDNYALLVQELREEFDRESSKTGRPRLLLTMAVPAGIEYIDKGYDIPKLNRYLDFMNILSYDYHSSFEPSVNHHSPLYPLEEEGEYNFDAQLSIDYTINHYLKLGADRDKLVLGIPTYGRSYTLFNPLSTEIGAPADGPGEQGDATREKGYLAYYEICENLESDEWKVVQPNPRAMGPYAYKGNQWVGYDDEDIVKKKARYVNEKRLGGIMYWAIDNDDFRGKCHGRPYPLIEAGKEAMLEGSGTSNEVEATPSRGKGGRPKSRVTTEESVIVNSGGGSSRPSSGKRRRPSSKTKSEKRASTTTSTTTSTTPAYSYPTATPEPPTTPDPGSDFKCEDEGFFPHPRDCKKYFWCLDSGPSNLGIVAHQFTCPSGLYFNKGADSCDYARNVVCNTKKTEAATTTAKPTTTTSKNVRISSTTTTTTTTEAPEEEEEEDYEEYDEEPEEDPKSIKELIDLIKKLGGIENLEKQLHLDGSEKKEESNLATAPPAISKKLYNRVLSQASVRANNNPNLYNPSGKSSTPHTLIYKNRGRQNEGLDNLAEVASGRQERPQYVTIRRERPTTPTTPEETDEDNEDDDEEDEVEEVAKKDIKSPGREYVTIRRDRPAKTAETEVTTSKYSSLRRPKPTKAEVESEVVEVPVTTVADETTSETIAVVKAELPAVSRKKLSPFLPRTAKIGSVLEPFRRKKKEEEVITTTEGVKEEPELSTTTAGLSRQKVRPSSLPYLDIVRGRVNKLNATQSPLEDDSHVNISSASTSAPHIDANKKSAFRSTTTTTSSTEEPVTLTVETDPPSTTLEPETTVETTTSTTSVPPTSTSEPSTSEPSSPSSTTESLPLSTTTQFTPTVTRVVTSESESGTTERHRILLSKYKGFYLTVASPAAKSTTPVPNKATTLVEKIMEVNRITQVTFNDDFSIPFTRPITSTPTKGDELVTPLSGDSSTVASTDGNSDLTDLPESYLSNVEAKDQSNGLNLDETTALPEVTIASTSLSTEGRKRFRQPFRGTSTTRSPLPKSQRRRTTTPISSLPEVSETSEESSTRKPFVPKRRGSYRPNSKTIIADDTTVIREEDDKIFARRPSSSGEENENVGTVRPIKIPEYKSRGRNKLSTARPVEVTRVTPEVEQTFSVEPQRGDVQPEVQVSSFAPRRPGGRFAASTTERTAVSTADNSARSRSRYVNRGRKKAVPQNETVQEQVDVDTNRNVLKPTRVGGRVVKKIRSRRPVNGTTTTTTTTTTTAAFDPTTGLTDAPTFTSTFAEENKTVESERQYTTPPPTEMAQDVSTLYSTDGLTDLNTMIDEIFTSTPQSVSEDFDTRINDEGKLQVNYDILPKDEVLQTQYSTSVALELPERGSHKFSLDDVLIRDTDGDVDESSTAKPATSSRRRPQNSPNTYETIYDYQNSVRGNSDVNRIADSKRRRVVKRKRISDRTSTTVAAGEDGDEEVASQGEIISSTARPLRRPAGSFYSNSRLRSRSTTTSTTSTTEVPKTTRLVSLRPPGRRQVVNRRRKLSDTTTSTLTAATTTEATETEAAITALVTNEPDIITLDTPRKFSFPRRRAKVGSGTTINSNNSEDDNSNFNNVKTLKFTVKAALNHVVDSQNEPSSIEGIQSENPRDAEEASPSSLPDLANDAVVAIHNLATIPTRNVPREKVNLVTPTTFILPAVTSPRPPRISTTAAPFYPRRGTAVYVTSSPAPQYREPNQAAPRPFSKITSHIDPQSSSVEDYEYYDHGEGIFGSAPAAGKVKIHADGYIECLDQGNFPHPFSCKKFISCAKMENTDVLGWEYTCPRHLSFDPIGGICNWSAGLGCKE